MLPFDRSSFRVKDLFSFQFVLMSLGPRFSTDSQKLPGVHEVMFYNETEDSPGVMMWRYPEPRILTFVRITPVPFNTTEDPEISTADLGDVLQVRTVVCMCVCMYGQKKCRHIKKKKGHIAFSFVYAVALFR